MPLQIIAYWNHNIKPCKIPSRPNQVPAIVSTNKVTKKERAGEGARAPRPLFFRICIISLSERSLGHKMFKWLSHSSWTSHGLADVAGGFVHALKRLAAATWKLAGKPREVWDGKSRRERCLSRSRLRLSSFFKRAKKKKTKAKKQKQQQKKSC